MRETTVAASLMIDLVAQLERQGIAREELCRRARIDPSLLSRAHDRMPGSASERIWALAEALTGDPLLGLHAAEHHKTGATNILGYVLLNCATGAECLERLTRYAGLLNDGLGVTVTPEGEQVVVRFSAIPGLDNFLERNGRQIMETMAAGTVVTLRQLTGAPFVPRQVWFRHPAAGPVTEYHRIFGAPVRFGQAEDRISFTARELALPIAAADPSLLALFEAHARKRLDELEQWGGITQRVAQLLVAKLGGGVPTVDDVAVALAMSGRQLQRKLQDEGITFQALLDRVRRDLSLVQLRVPGTTAAEVALALGYSEASAFSRAFRRWTGLAPGAYAAGEEPRETAGEAE